MNQPKRGVNLLNPCDYKFTPLVKPNGVFDHLIQPYKTRRSVGPVLFDSRQFQHMDEFRNGANFSTYGTCSVDEYESVLLDDDTILFCVVSGTVFVDTFSENDTVTMQYYEVTPI